MSLSVANLRQAPDDVTRIILKHVAEDGKVLRAVCKSWLRISSSLMPFFLNRMKAMQTRIAMLEEQLDLPDMEWTCRLSTMRLLKRGNLSHIACLCRDFGVNVSGTKQQLAENLAEQLHYETDDDEED